MRATMALTFIYKVGADLQLMQMSLHSSVSGGPDGCRTSVKGDECYEKVLWAMQTGVVEHPDWYQDLTKDSSFEDFQQHLHGNVKLSDLCPKPCFAPEAAKLRISAEAQEEVDTDPRDNFQGKLNYHFVMRLWPPPPLPHLLPPPPDLPLPH